MFHCSKNTLFHCRDWRKLVACQIYLKFSKFPFSHCSDLFPFLLEKQICHWVLAKFQQNSYMCYITWKRWWSRYLFLPQDLCGSWGCVCVIILGLFNLFFSIIILGFFISHLLFSQCPCVYFVLKTGLKNLDVAWLFAAWLSLCRLAFHSSH